MAGASIQVPEMLRKSYDGHERIRAVYDKWLQGIELKVPEEKFHTFLKGARLANLQEGLAAVKELAQVTQGKEGKKEVVWFTVLIEAAEELSTLHELKIHGRAPLNAQERQLLTQTTTMDVMSVVAERLAEQALVETAASKRSAATTDVMRQATQGLSVKARAAQFAGAAPT